MATTHQILRCEILAIVYAPQIPLVVFDRHPALFQKGLALRPRALIKGLTLFWGLC